MEHFRDEFSFIWSLANFLINYFPTECELCKKSIYQKRAATLLYARFPYVGSRLSSPWWIMIDIFDLALWPTFQASTIKFCVFGVFILLRHTMHSGLKKPSKSFIFSCLFTFWKSFASGQLFIYIYLFFLASLTWMRHFWTSFQTLCSRSTETQK